MTLKQYITKHGDEKCATLFDVKPRTAKSWRLGQRFPSREKALEITQKTKLKLIDIYGD